MRRSLSSGRVAQVLGAVAVLAGGVHLWQAPPGNLPRLSPLAAAPPLELRSCAPGACQSDAFRGGPGHSGRSPHRGPRRPHVRYTFVTDGPVRGRVAVDHAGRPAFASYDGKLYALDAAGRLRFARRLGAPSHGGPVWTRAGHLVVGTDAGRLWRFDAGGEPLSNVDLGAAIDAPPSEAPDGSLWVAAGHRVFGLSADLDQRLHTLASDGRVVAAPAIGADGAVFVVGHDHQLRAYEPDGRLRFVHDLRVDLEVPPLVHADVLWLAGDHGLVAALRVRDGQRIFEIRVDGHVRAPLSLGGGVLWLQTFGPRPALRALSSGDGRTLGGHRFPLLDSDQEGSRSGPLVDADGALFMGGPDHAIYGFDARGQQRFRIETAGIVHGSPNLAPDGTLFVGCDDGRVYALSDRP